MTCNVKYKKIIAVNLKAIDIKKPLTFKFFSTKKVAIDSIYSYMKENYKDFYLVYNSKSKYIFKVNDYGEDKPYWLRFSLKSIKVYNENIFK